jgi:hypothetical protein
MHAEEEVGGTPVINGKRQLQGKCTIPNFWHALSPGERNTTICAATPSPNLV